MPHAAESAQGISPRAAPDGCLDEAMELIKANGAKPQLADERQRGTVLDVSFLGKLHNVQVAAVAALEPLDFGVLAANGGSQVAGLARPLTSGCIPISVMILPP